jgi:hypothetical protein
MLEPNYLYGWLPCVQPWSRSQDQRADGIPDCEITSSPLAITAAISLTTWHGGEEIKIFQNNGDCSLFRGLFNDVL